MKLALVSLVALSLVAAALATTGTVDPFPQFMKFVQQHKKEYATLEEFLFRFQTFKASLERVRVRRNQHQLETGEDGSAIYGVTKFSDLTPQEFKDRYLRYNPRSLTLKQRLSMSLGITTPTPKVGDNNTLMDWRQYGAVTAVKDQGQCGSCWAFSAAEEIESSFYLANGTLYKLSPQQIVSCDTVDGGCDGGDTPSAYQYVEKAGGLETEQDYPYTSGNGDSGSCKFKKSNIVASISGFTYATPPCDDSCNNQDEDTLGKNLENEGPVSICVYAEPWQDYTGGVMKSGCSHDYYDLDHCVQLVGYNKQGSNNYWLVRNSWNTDWGEDGYIWLQIGKNVCGVADEATIATI